MKKITIKLNARLSKLWTPALKDRINTVVCGLGVVYLEEQSDSII